MADSLDPELAAVVEEIESLDVLPWSSMTVEEARRVEDELFSQGSGEPAIAAVDDHSFDGPVGAVPVRVYRPEDGTDDDGAAIGNPSDRPILVFFHGGGWTLGTLDGVDDICRELANRISAVVVSVDYHLAPEHRFPVQVEEAHAAATWAVENASSLGGDPGRVAVGGTSAGGNLAAAAALLARERDGPTLAHQLLLYPITDCSFDTDSYRANADGPLLTRADMRWFWEQYRRHDLDAHNPLASVLRTRDLAGLPPATVVTAGFDPLRDDGAAYATRLADAGVPVEHLDYPRMCHGFLSLTEDVAVADAAMDEVVATLRRG